MQMPSMRHVRVLYVPNERVPFGQRGVRQALQALLESGAVESVKVFSPLLRLTRRPDTDINRELIEVASTFRPDVIFVQHLAHTRIEGKTWAFLKDSLGCSIAYHEGDIYDSFRKRFPIEVGAVAQHADHAFTIGASSQITHLKRLGFKNVSWVPSVYNHRDFGQGDLSLKRVADVTMIANESSSRLPFMSMPGSKHRRDLARLCASRFGSKFALYGRGWAPSLGAKTLSYLEQQAAVSESWLTVCWDHYPNEHCFFSDRLPISLAVGTIHITSYHPGYEQIFPRNVDFIHFAERPEEVCTLAEEILRSWDMPRRLSAIADARTFAQRFRQDRNFLHMLSTVGVPITPAVSDYVLSARCDPAPGE